MDSCNLDSIVRSALALFIALSAFAGTRAARAAEPPPERALTTGEIEEWLERPSGAPVSDEATPGPEEAPPAPPRKHGLTVESGVGAASHLGALKNITPTSPWFHLKVGFEPFRWLMAFAETDLLFSNTGFAHPPPPSRTYRLYGFGGGLRGTYAFSERFGAYLDASGGIAETSNDVLEVYGYRQSTRWKAYFGGQLGLDWYPVNPHLTISVHGGVRSYQAGLRRERSSEQALLALGGLSLRYTF
jgi:hypothetical protein